MMKKTVHFVSVLLASLCLSAYAGENYNDLMQKGKTAFGAGKIAEADDFYADAVMAAGNPEEKQQALAHLGECRERAKNYAGAVKVWLEAGAIPHKRAWIPLMYRRQAAVLMSRKLKQKEEALKIFAEIVKEEKYSLALYFAVETAVELGKFDEAGRLLKEALAQPGRPLYFNYDICIATAKVKLGRRDYEGAIGEYEKIAGLQGVTENYLARMNYYVAATYENNLKDKARAREFFQKCADRKIDNWHTGYARRWLKQNSGK